MKQAAKQAFVSWAAATCVVALVALATGAPHIVRADEPLPFEAHFGRGWTVETLPGMSSDPRDADRGVRQRAQRDDEEGRRVIEIGCAWLDPGDPPDVAAQLREISRGVGAGLAQQGLTFDSGPVRDAKLGTRAWKVLDFEASLDGIVRYKQRLAAITTKRCFLVAQYAGAPDAWQAGLGDFERALSGLKAD